MQYILLLYENDDERVAKTEGEVSVCLAYAEAMRKAGILVGGERLRPAWDATRLRVAEGRTQVMDGPYAEAKEQLGGFHIIDVPDRDTAIAWAARCPSAARGRVEVRPIWTD
jgi:hypothetical protein